MAIELTDEMRQAVLAEMCEKEGHYLSLGSALVRDEQGHNQIGSQDPGRLPHLSCSRCGRAWIIVDDPGTNYDDAAKKFRGRLRDGDPRKKG